MICSRDIRSVGRSSMLLLQSETFEEERILKAIESVVKQGGRIVIETEEKETTADFVIRQEAT